MVEQKFRYYVVYEVQGYWNSFTEFLSLPWELSTEDAIVDAVERLRTNHSPTDQIKIMNWKRVD